MKEKFNNIFLEDLSLDQFWCLFGGHRSCAGYEDKPDSVSFLPLKSKYGLVPAIERTFAITLPMTYGITPHVTKELFDQYFKTLQSAYNSCKNQESSLEEIRKALNFTKRGDTIFQKRATLYADDFTIHDLETYIKKFYAFIFDGSKLKKEFCYNYQFAIFYFRPKHICEHLKEHEPSFFSWLNEREKGESEELSELERKNKYGILLYSSLHLLKPDNLTKLFNQLTTQLNI